jgi:hypothetical protein
MLAQGASDSVNTLPPEFAMRSKVVGGHEINYRLVDVSIRIERTLGLNAEANLVLVGAGPTAHYDVDLTGTDYRSTNAKMPLAELTAIVDSLDLCWLGLQEPFLDQLSVCKKTDPRRSSTEPELTIAVRVGEYGTCIRCGGVLYHKDELPSDVVKFMNQVLHSPTVSKMVSEIGDRLSNESGQSGRADK